MSHHPPMAYRVVASQFRSAGFHKRCGPIALMLLLDLSLPQAVSTCSLRAGYRGYRRGTKTRRALRSLGMTLSEIPVPPRGRSERNQLALIAESLVKSGYAKGRYVVLSKRRKSPGRWIKHASAVVDGKLLDWAGTSPKGFRIRSIYRVEGDLDNAARKARRLADAVSLSQQPLARKPLLSFCTRFIRHHGLPHRYRLLFRHNNGRRKRSDTMVEWYPLKLHCQSRAGPNSNVRSLLDSVHNLLSTDFSRLQASLVDHRGIPIHGNTRIRTLRRKRTRGRPRPASAS